MGRGWRYSIVPALGALAAVFLVLPTTGADATVTIAEVEGGAWAYEPAELSVAVGDRIAFTNETEVTHTANCLDCPWKTGDIQPGQTKMVTFIEDLRATFVCRYHSELLVGTLVVGNPGPAESAPGPSPAATPTG